MIDALAPPRCLGCGSCSAYRDDSEVKCLPCGRVLLEIESQAERVRRQARPYTGPVNQPLPPVDLPLPPKPPRKPRSDRWTPEHLALLRTLIADRLSLEEMAEVLTQRFGVVRSPDAVKGRALAQGWKRPRRPDPTAWTEEHLAVLRGMVAIRANVADIALALTARFGIERTPNACRTKASLLGLSLEGLGWDRKMAAGQAGASS